MNEDTRIVVELYFFEGLALIVPGATGIIYEQQGCNMHRQRRLEGFFVPLLVHLPPPCDIANQLSLYFDGPKWWGECCWGIDDETADFVERALSNMPGLADIKVDRTKLDESMESWIHVRVSGDGSPKILYGATEEHAAVLTWSWYTGPADNRRFDFGRQARA
jgi:Family of unknown function (DUF6210)